MIGNNLTAAIPENATSGKTNLCKKLKIMNSDEKICICIYVKHGK